ncbi:hypothetical protein Y032_0083g1656 [Ancylostoma ceylanicum]|uniref:glucuronosyltransferase n=1 Tax=Ancylostoma ceylanicum TaxID=53326 RepID=A0A016TR56_9BILA|nr:hypothetical protein Y032_0083g1656 [Ancylostoma ceylanicum]
MVGHDRRDCGKQRVPTETETSRSVFDHPLFYGKSFCTAYVFNNMRILVLNLILLQYYVSASNILIWSPTIGHSHVKFLGNIADVLTADGHNVTIFSPTMDPDVTTFGNRLPARTLRFTAHGTNDRFHRMEMKRPSLWESPPCTGVCFKWSDYDLVHEQNMDYCKEFLEDEGTIKALSDSKFELVFTESFDMCAPGIFQILGINKIVMVSALGMYHPMYDIIGLAELPSFMPEGLTPYSDDMTFLERLTNFKVNIQLKFHIRRWNREFWKVFNAKYPGFPTIQEINNEKTCLIMTNVNEFAETPRPTTNMIKYVGGSTLHDPKALPEDLDKLLNERSATVLFSLGSIAQSKDMPSWLKNVLFLIGRITTPSAITSASWCKSAYTATLPPLHELALVMRGDTSDMAAKEQH